MKNRRRAAIVRLCSTAPAVAGETGNLTGWIEPGKPAARRIVE